MLISRPFWSRALALKLKHFPAVAVLGARQCGKTTLAKMALPKWTYLDLERPSHLARVEADPEHFLATHASQLVFDEAHLFHKLFNVLRPIIDETRSRKGRFVLLGSASPVLSSCSKTPPLAFFPLILS